MEKKALTELQGVTYKNIVCVHEVCLEKFYVGTELLTALNITVDTNSSITVMWNFH